MLGAEVHLDTWRPAADQRLVAVRVADVIEACCDEWLVGIGPKGSWQDGALLASFCECLSKRQHVRQHNSWTAGPNGRPFNEIR